jgi:flagellar hook protein FlgE
MLRASKLISILILFCQLLLAASANANESYLQTLTGKLKQNDSCVVIDDKFRNLPLNEWNQLTHLSVNNLISFELRHDTSIYYYNRSFTCSLNVTIKYYTSRDQNTPEEISNIDLVVKYDTAKGAAYPSIAQYRFKDAFKVVVVINSITSPEWGENIPAIFRLSNQINIDRRYPFSPVVTGALEVNEVTDNPSGNIASFSIGSGITPDRKLSITWAQTDFPGSTENDLEWTYIDKESVEGRKIKADYTSLQGVINIPDDVVEKMMRNNSTRVTVTTQLLSEYIISLPYDEGYLLVRIRGAHQQVTPAMRITTNWVYRNSQNQTVCYQITVPHESNLNYQYTAAFAEEGKKKEIITYFDGAQKERQAVTVMNSDGTKKTSEGPYTPTATVAETIYDVLGRPTLQVLPAPVKNSSLGYYPAFNQNSSGAAFSHKDILLNSSSGLICGPGADMMNVANGASRYYSSNNDFIGDTRYPFTQYVPDAGKKPYTLTQYTSDNSGRIRRSWGVGDQFQPSANSAGRSTDYYYGKPSQKELDRLFGSEVGIASHYLKNMVVDPNGQISVAYQNAQGKTIATALAGAAPQNLEALPSSTKPESQSELTQRIISKNDFQRNTSDLKMQASSVFLASTNGIFTIYYNVDPLAVITKHGSPQQQFCSNCYYEVLVQVKNDCGELIREHSSQPFTVNNTSCDPLQIGTITDQFEATINKLGEYTITYTLQLSEQQIKYHTNYYIQNNSDLLKLQYFFQQELNKLDLKGCYSSCESCKTLGTKEIFFNWCCRFGARNPYQCDLR